MVGCAVYFTLVQTTRQVIAHALVVGTSAGCNRAVFLPASSSVLMGIEAMPKLFWCLLAPELVSCFTQMPSLKGDRARCEYIVIAGAQRRLFWLASCVEPLSDFIVVLSIQET